MLAALQANPDTSALLPFATLWYAEESTYAWVAGGTTQLITQAEGGEQGDPLMPGLFSLALVPALRSLHEELQPGEEVLRSWTIPTLQPRLTVPHIFVAASSATFSNTAKTAFWNAAGIAPTGLAEHDCEGHGWVGDPALDPSERGLPVLGVVCPLGRPTSSANTFTSSSSVKQPCLTNSRR